MIKILKNLTKKDMLYILISIILIILQVWTELKIPDYMSEITKIIQSEESNMKGILLNGGYMLICAFLSLVFAVITGYFISYVSSSFSQNVRSKLFAKVLAFSMGDVKEFQPSSLITRTTNDVTHIQMFLSMGLHLMFKAPITAIWAITKILNRNITWSIYTGITVIVILFVTILIMRKVLPRFKIVQKKIDHLNEVTRENINGIRVIRAFNAEKYEENKFDEASKSLTDLQLSNQKTMALMSPVMNLGMYVLALLIYVTGAYMIESSIFASKIGIFSDMVVFSSYSLQVIMSFLMLTMIFMMLPRANVSASRINEVLDKEITITDGKKNIKDVKTDGKVEFKNVSFKYPDAENYLLENISFTAQKGQTIAFIGSTGSGKSSLLNLIPRFYDVTDGEILIDDVNVKDYKLKDLYNKLGYVSQRPVMFNMSVNDNVSYGNSLNKKTDELINEALEVAQASTFVDEMDDKKNTIIAQGGTNISGGQKQRLSIARAIARKPEIYIFDDSFSALDYKTDSTLRKELKKYTDKATCLIIAQRIGTIMNADKIIVLDKGKCVGSGTHSELLKNCDVYKEIAYSQLTKEELENA